MIHGGVEENLDRWWKLFVAFPEDILKWYIGKSLQDERSISNLYRFSP
jgi:hypothetical protein